MALLNCVFAIGCPIGRQELLGMETQNTALSRERVDFSKIKASIPIPNLIEVQKNSYERFLQMDLLPNEREDIGLQTVFNSVFPISDFRGVSDLEFVDYSIGNWECKCGNLKGLHHLRSTCRNPAAAPPSAPTRSTQAIFSATTAARSTRTSSRSATSAATRWACS